MLNNLQQMRSLKIVEAIGDVIGNKIADKITRASKTSPQNNLEVTEEIL